MPVSPQFYLISSAIRNSDVGLLLEEGLDTYHFTTCAEEFEFLKRFWQRYKRTPSRTVFRKQFPEFPMRPVDDTGFYIDKVRDEHGKRILLAAAKDAADFVASDGDLGQAAQRFQKALLKVAAETNRSEDSDIFTDNKKILTDIKRRRMHYLKYGTSGIPTGLPTLDEYTGGPSAGEFWIIALRQGEGKSYTMQTMAVRAAMQNRRVMFCALEQTRAQVAMRIFGMMSGEFGQNVFAANNLMKGHGYDPKEFATFLRKMRREYRNAGTEAIHVTDKRAANTVLGISAKIDKNEPAITFVDYVQRVKGSGSYSEERSRYAETSEGLANMAVDYDLPVIGASQLNRDTLNRAGGVGGTENLGGTDKLGDDASVVLVGVKQSPHVRYFKCVKNRNDQDGWGFYVEYDPSNGVFKEITAEQAQDKVDTDEYEIRKAQKKAKGR